MLDGRLFLSPASKALLTTVQTGDLPIRQSVGQDSSVVQQMNTAVPGMATFISNLGNVTQARPQIAQYPKISTILGNMLVSVLLGKSQPQAALAAAAQQVNQALAAG